MARSILLVSFVGILFTFRACFTRIVEEKTKSEFEERLLEKFVEIERSMKQLQDSVSAQVASLNDDKDAHIDSISALREEIRADLKTQQEATRAEIQTLARGQQRDLPECNSVQDIAIIGAGVTGSYAAWRMRTSGMTVSLYEYSNRIGGRCHTVKFPGIPDVNIEMGAIRFRPRDHPLLSETVDALGLQAVDFKLGGSMKDNLYYLRGKHLRYSELAAEAPYDLHPDHRIDPYEFQWQLFKNFTDADINEDGYNKIPQKLFIKSKDGVPLYKQSRQSFYTKYLGPDTVEYITDMSGWDSFYGDNAAANWLLMSDPSLWSASPPNPVKTIQTGFQSIPETMVDQFLKASSKHSFHRNHHLRSLKKNQDGVYVLTFQPTLTVRGVTKDNMNLPRKHTCAKKVLLAIPRLALEHLDWDVLKHPEIKDYIQNSLAEAKAGRMYFAYDAPWWREIPLASPTAISTTPLRQSFDFATSPSTGKAVLKPGYPSLHTEIWRDAQKQGFFVPGVGDDTIAMSNVGVNMARKMYAEIYNISNNDVKQPNYAVMSIWDTYPIGASWYSWKSGYIWEDVENKMAQPSVADDVFIISNTFSKNRKQGVVEGALEIVDRTLAKYFPDI